MRLLCADDEPDIRTILELALSLEPRIDAEIVPSGVALLERVKTFAPDAILLDAMMPALDGYETCRQLKANPDTANIPVVFLTARAQRGEQDTALAVGAVACLTKPFDPLTLAGELLVVLGREGRAPRRGAS
jgi:CheY-like chemotaxis protein